MLAIRLDSVPLVIRLNSAPLVPLSDRPPYPLLLIGEVVPIPRFWLASIKTACVPAVPNDSVLPISEEIYALAVVCALFQNVICDSLLAPAVRPIRSIV